MNKAIIIGATSGIGKAIARKLSENGYEIGITGRRTELLEQLSNEISSRVYFHKMDVSKAENAITIFSNLVNEMGSVDLVIINAGIGNNNRDYQWEIERQTIDVNIRGFTAIANIAFNYFENQGHGHIVGISSVASHFSYGKATAYNASKAFVSNYLKGLRYKAFQRNSNIIITDVRPGFVDTPMTMNNKGMFWVIGADKAAKLIYHAIEKGKKQAYIPARWRIIAWLLHVVPEGIFKRI